MREPSHDTGKQREGRSRGSIAIIAALLVFCVTAVALWSLTTIGLIYALMAAAPAMVVVACATLTLDAVADWVAAIVEALVAIFVAIGEAVAAIAAAVLAALAAVFSIFGG